jgi:aminoglycoside 3'-phosphotransferase I
MTSTTITRGWSAEQVWNALAAMLPIAADRVVTHGDFSMGNLLFAEGRITGCIDVGRAGVADRYQDLAIFWQNLAEHGPGFQEQFLRAYGVDAVDPDRLRFHRCLDELF